jgi:hypothetical protein
MEKGARDEESFSTLFGVKWKEYDKMSTVQIRVII